jgi:hypothetical protein
MRADELQARLLQVIPGYIGVDSMMPFKEILI